MNVDNFAPTSGGNRRAQKRKQARLYDGAGPRKSAHARQIAALASTYDPQYATGYRVTVRHDRVPRLEYRQPARVIPQCERPSPLVTRRAE